MKNRGLLIAGKDYMLPDAACIIIYILQYSMIFYT